jgi:hypothetical protein
MADQDNRPDLWARLESFAKILAGFSAAVSAILIPVFINSYTEENRRTEMFVRTMTEREKSDTDIRQSMFNTLLTGYLGSLKEDFVKADEDAFRRRITFLELLTINFQEFFNAKPLFEEVYTGLLRKRVGPQTPQERKKWDDLERQIIRVSMNIVSRQAKMLNNIGTSAVFNIEKGEQICVRLYRREELETLQAPDGSRLKSFIPGSCPEASREKGSTASADPTNDPSPRQSLEIKLISVNRAYATVQVAIYEDFFKGNVFQGSRLKGSSELDISYFDLPYMDNTKLSDGSRFALVRRYTGSDSSEGSLGEVEETSVEIEAIRFRNDFVSLRDRPFFEEMLQKLKKEEK